MAAAAVAVGKTAVTVGGWEGPPGPVRRWNRGWTPGTPVSAPQDGPAARSWAPGARPRALGTVGSFG